MNPANTGYYLEDFNNRQVQIKKKEDLRSQPLQSDQS